MCDMTVLYYILLGIYTTATEQDPKNAWKLRATLDIKETLFEYAVALGDGTTYDETVDKCVRLGPMLLAHCRRATDMDWTKSSFYKWLEKEMRGRERLARSSSRGDSAMPPGQQTTAAVSAVSTPGAVQSITQASEPHITLRSRSQSQTPAAVPQQLPFRVPPDPAEATGADTPALSSPHEGPSPSIAADTATEIPSLPIANAVPLSSSTAVSAHLRTSVFDTYLKIIERLGETYGDPSRIAVTRLHSLLFSKYRVRSYSTVKNLSAFFSHELASKLSDAWRGSPYEKWLLSAEVRASAPISDSFLRDLPDQLLPGVPLLHVSDTTASAEPTSRSNSPQTAGKRAVLRPSTISRKRRLDSPDNGADGEIETGPKSASQEGTPQPNDRPRKVARNSQDGGVDSEIEPQSMQVDIDNSTSSEDSSIDNDLESDAERKEETILAIRIEPLLVSTKPTGPNHTWTCPEPGCSFIVRGGLEASGSDEDDSEKDATYDTNTRISAHLHGHEQKTLSCVDLAISEGTRGRVSVDHLLDKIRTLADKATGQQTLPASKVASSGTSTRRSRFFF